MTDDGPPTRPRSPSSIRISTWGIVQAWLAVDEAREIQVRADSAGLYIVAFHESLGVQHERVADGEDPSRAVLRATGRFEP